MISDVYIVINDDSQKDRIASVVLQTNPFFHFIDERRRDEIKNAYRLKGSFAAKQTPFAVVYDENHKPLKAFYSEAGDVINSLINYLNL